MISLNSIEDLPKRIPIFPLTGAVLFPGTQLPLNIFESRYIQMIDDCIKVNRIIGIIQPKKSEQKIPDLFKIGCAGKITSFDETEDGRYLIVLNGVSRFKIIEEVKTDKLYRLCNVSFKEFGNDLNNNHEKIQFSDLELIFKNLKTLFQKRGYVINWKELKKQSLNQTINALSMASPFSLEEKQVLLESQNLNLRKSKLEEILKTYLVDNFSNTTVQ